MIFCFCLKNHVPMILFVKLNYSSTYSFQLSSDSLSLSLSQLATRKMLCLHIPSLLPHTAAEYDHDPCVQNAAVMGIGLLYMSSVHRLMAEFLIKEVGRRPANDRGCVDRESYALSAGIALGMVTLGQGGNVAGHLYKGLSDLHLEDRLQQYMVGGSNMSETGSSEEHWMRCDNRYSLDHNGLHAVGRGRRRGGRRSTSALDGVFKMDMTNPITGGTGVSGQDRKSEHGGDGSGTSSCSRIFEGPQVNIDVTSAGATMALGLMYLKTNDLSVADRLAVRSLVFFLLLLLLLFVFHPSNS